MRLPGCFIYLECNNILSKWSALKYETYDPKNSWKKNLTDAKVAVLERSKSFNLSRLSHCVSALPPQWYGFDSLTMQNLQHLLTHPYHKAKQSNAVRRRPLLNSQSKDFLSSACVCKFYSNPREIHSIYPENYVETLQKGVQNIYKSLVHRLL